jgi:hypothetical protein
MRPFALASASTETPYSLLMSYSVSPALTVWYCAGCVGVGVAFAGVGVGGIVSVGVGGAVSAADGTPLVALAVGGVLLTGAVGESPADAVGLGDGVGAVVSVGEDATCPVTTLVATDFAGERDVAPSPHVTASRGNSSNRARNRRDSVGPG